MLSVPADVSRKNLVPHVEIPGTAVVLLTRMRHPRRIPPTWCVGVGADGKEPVR